MKLRHEVRYPTPAAGSWWLLPVVALALIKSPGPVTAGSPGIDLELGDVDNVSMVGRVGTFPDGRSAFSAGTTVCNSGQVDLPWFAPMEEGHPLLAFQAYRLRDDRFEQIGWSDLRHGFFPLPASFCASCGGPGPPGVLPPSCSTANAVATNADRTWLAPRQEVNPFLGSWSCVGSHFAGGEPDCVRRHFGSGHDPLEHRLQISDPDLASGDAFFFEAFWIIEGDDQPRNNLGSSAFSADFTGAAWDIETEVLSFLPGPALERWGGLQTWETVPDDGELLLGAETAHLGGGDYRYEYALFNLNSDRAVRRFQIPVGPGLDVTGLGFHDADADPSNDWIGQVQGGLITWEVPSYDVDPEANALTFGLLFNFRFEADTPPAGGAITLTAWKPGATDIFAMESTVPATSASVAASDRTAAIELQAIPNPFVSGTLVRLRLPSEQRVRLAVFDVRGRPVRHLADRPLGPGSVEIEFDGRSSLGHPLPSGVYYLHAQLGSRFTTRPVHLVR